MMRKDYLNVDYIKLLKGDYKDIFERIDIYISSKNLVMDSHSVIMEDILDLLLTAQENGTCIEDVIGNDVEYFCDGIIESHKRSFFDNIIEWFGWYRYLVLGYGIIELVSLLVDISDHINNAMFLNVDMGIFIICMSVPFFIAYLFNIIRKNLIFKYKWYNSRLDMVLSIAVVVMMMVFCFIVPDYVDSIVSIPRIIFIPLSIIFFIYTNYKKKEQKKIEKEKGDYIDYWDSVYNEVLKLHRKKYDKYIKKCEKKNLDILTVREWYEREYSKDHKAGYLARVFFVLIVLFFVFSVFLDSETYFDSFLFTGILLLIEIPIYRWLDKGEKVRDNLYKDIKEKDSDIFDDSLFKEE